MRAFGAVRNPWVSREKMRSTSAYLSFQRASIILAPGFARKAPDTVH